MKISFFESPLRRPVHSLRCRGSEPPLRAAAAQCRFMAERRRREAGGEIAGQFFRLKQSRWK